jgi:hypothetical protein
MSQSASSDLPRALGACALARRRCRIEGVAAVHPFAKLDMFIRHWQSREATWGNALTLCWGGQIAESGVDRGSDSGVEVEARIGSYVRSSQCRIDPSNGQSPVV